MILAVGFLLSQVLPVYYVYLATAAVIAAISLAGLGVITGSAGMIALCQLSFAAVGAWVVSFLAAHDVPGGLYVSLWLGGAVAGLLGLVIGTPALRLRGVNLAVVTLGFAAAMDLSLRQVQYAAVPRPSPFLGDRAYFQFAVLVLALVAVALHLLQGSRIGTAWKFVSFSERATASAGASVSMSKLTAFAVGATLAGLAGGLLSGQIGTVYATNFTAIQSLALYVLTVVVGAHFIDMAVLGGVLWVVVPEVLKTFGISQDWGFVVFGLMGIHGLTGNLTMGQQVRDLVAKARRRPEAEVVGIVADATAPHEPSAEARAGAATGGEVSVADLSVSFGHIHALADVDLGVRPGAVLGLIGPNGAGKSTFIDALTGFLTHHEGTISLDGRNLAGLGPTARARAGLRRTYQQDRVPDSITVGDYVRFLARGAVPVERMQAVLDHFGCPSPRTPLARVDAGSRRIVEVAANVAAGPAVLLLDEPAAGVSHAERDAFARAIAATPDAFGVTVLIVEHDLDLVRAACTELVALDFGRVIAAGTCEAVLADPAVLTAYMGEVETYE